MLDDKSSSVPRRVWLRAFWGFNPEDEGYVGFTKAGDRDRFLREYEDGDLFLIYGADQERTERAQRRQVLGFLEVEPIPVFDAERSSDPNRTWKIENGWQDRWTHGVPVRRAWRINRRVEAHHLARQTFATHNAVLIASRGELLTINEARQALRLPVTPVNVFGEPPLLSEQPVSEKAMNAYFRPSLGVTPSFGDRSYSLTDTYNRLYALKLDGDIGAFLGRQRFQVAKKMIVKVGYAKEPQQRCDTHNNHLPPASQFKWKVALTSQPFPGAVEAKAAEDELKAAFERQFESLGGEFFLVDEIAASASFSNAVRAVSFVISTTD